MNEQPSAPTGSREQQVSELARYFAANRDRFTEEALAQSARSGGHAADVVAEAIAKARADAGGPPIRERARRWVLAAYLVTFAGLTIGMFSSESSRQYGGHVIGTVILSLTLGLAWLISLLWLRRVGRGVAAPPVDLVTLLAVPIILLVVVAGLCIGTGLPIPRAY